MDDVLCSLVLEVLDGIILYRPKDWSAGDGQIATLHSSCEEKKEREGKGDKEKRDTSVWTSDFMVHPAPDMGFSTIEPSAQQHETHGGNRSWEENK